MIIGQIFLDVFMIICLLFKFFVIKLKYHEFGIYISLNFSNSAGHTI